MKKFDLSAYEENLFFNCVSYWSGEALLGGDALDAAEAKKAIRFWYKKAGISEPDIIIADSPMGCQHAIADFGCKNKRPLISVEQIIRQKMAAIVWSGVDETVAERVARDLRYRIEFEICSQIGTPVKQQVWLRVCRQIKRQLGPNFEDFSCWGLAWMADWCCFYDFWERIGITNNAGLRLLLEQAKAGTFMSVLMDRLAVLSRRPLNISRNSSGELHSRTGAAIEWRDGCRFYFLNGIPVNEKIITTPGRELDSALLLETENAEERLEIVRKIGIERICRELGAKIIDKWNGYELLELPLHFMTIRAKYLKMRNPSLGVYHLEGVPPEIMTCQDALNWRIGGRLWNPAKLT